MYNREKNDRGEMRNKKTDRNRERERDTKK